jgi:alkanesulfonate monooxygenase SsuD/methylene tetrahydromethanopterin reductase-like flavin-dependent oxidoreductase (luciferase family)
VGWNEQEYAALGVKKSERGKRTDEILDILIPLLEGETVTYDGQFYSVDDLFIEPISAQRPEIWIGGGSQLADPKSPDLPRFVESVKARVLRTDGWIPRPTCPPAEIARDWRELQDYYRQHGRDPRECVVAHENFMHLVMTNDPAKARREQHEAFLRVMSNERGPSYLESVYLFGTPDELIASLQARVDAGVEYLALHTMTPDPAQLQLWVDEIIPNVKFPPTAGPVRRNPAPVPGRSEPSLVTTP